MSLNFGIDPDDAHVGIRSKFNQLKQEHARLEQELIDFALEHGLELSLEQGSLVHGNCSEGWYSHERGDWFTSTDSCS